MKYIPEPLWFNAEVHNSPKIKKTLAIWEIVINRDEYRKFLINGIKMFKDHESRKDLGK